MYCRQIRCEQIILYSAYSICIALYSSCSELSFKVNNSNILMTLCSIPRSQTQLREHCDSVIGSNQIFCTGCITFLCHCSYHYAINGFSSSHFDWEETWYSNSDDWWNCRMLFAEISFVLWGSQLSLSTVAQRHNVIHNFISNYAMLNLFQIFDSVLNIPNLLLSA